MRAMVAIYNTNTAAASGVLGWTLIGYFRHGRKFSVIGACEGAIAGLVGITPAAGFVSLWIAAVIGFLTAVVISLFENVNTWLRIDDGLEVFKLHGIGGMTGAFLTGIFATEGISKLDGFTIANGAIDGNGVQVGKQLAEICAIASWSFVCSAIILLGMKYIPGLHLRVDSDIEIMGYDVDQFEDELIGEWSLFETSQLLPENVTHGLPINRNSISSVRTSEKVAPAEVETKAA